MRTGSTPGPSRSVQSLTHVDAPDCRKIQVCSPPTFKAEASAFVRNLLSIRPTSLHCYTMEAFHVDSSVSSLSEKRARTSPSRPTLSVVIPTRGRPERLGVSLAALRRQTVPPLEIIVVDDGSPDAAAVATVVETGGARVLRQDGAGVAAARNAGVRVARGACVAFTDDDCEAAPDWVENLTGAIAAGADAVGGRMINACPENPFDTALQVIQDFLSLTGTNSGSRATYAPGANLACKTELLLALPFDERYRGAAEERDWCLRLIELGHVLVSEPAAIVYHRQELDFRSFWRKNVHYGRGAYTFRRAARQTRPLERPEFYRELVRHGFAAGTAVGILVLVSQVATALGFLEARATASWPPR